MGVSRRAFLTRSVAAVAAAGVARSATSAAAVLAPGSVVFPSGVASGDPTTDGVILWTRVDPDLFDGARVQWSVFRADAPAVDVARGGALVDRERDGTVHVPVSGLEPGTRYGFRFVAGTASIEGVTRTLPDSGHVRIGVVSCSKHSDGWFNAYRELAAMDCDVVLHLGDYIYASGGGADDPLGRWGTIPARTHVPETEVSTLEGYRARYRQYRADPDLQALHASVPVVAVWDDNDIANNAWRDGNQAGDEGRVWERRKRDGQTAWAEYHPARVKKVGGELQIWRQLRAGGLVDLYLLDTRLQRDQQVSNAAAESSAANDDPDRTMLGPVQKAWLVDGLVQSEATWRVIGQGIVMTHWRVVGGPEHVGQLLDGVPLVQDEADGGVYWNSDGWDGYTAERRELFGVFEDVGDVVVLTGDVHSSWANELVPDADPTREPVGVEFVAPAVSTRPFASNVQGATPPFEAAFTAANPWIKWCDMDANGFLVLDLDERNAIASWYEVSAREAGATAKPMLSWKASRGSSRLLPNVG